MRKRDVTWTRIFFRNVHLLKFNQTKKYFFLKTYSSLYVQNVKYIQNCSTEKQILKKYENLQLRVSDTA